MLKQQVDFRFANVGNGRLAGAFGLAILISILGCSSARAGGTCLLRPEAFRLQSDTVRWSIKINAGGECIQGLRWSTTMIDSVSVIEQPKLGRIVVQGPSFRYFSNPGQRGTDTFRLSIAGSALRIKGTSSIEVEISIQ